MADTEAATNLKSTGEEGKVEVEETGSSSQMCFEMKKWNAVRKL
jgi:hypothetical protein